MKMRINLSMSNDEMKKIEDVFFNLFKYNKG